MAKIPSKKADLKAFLKARGVGQTGDRKTLQNLARLYVNRPVVISGTDLAIAPEQTSLPNDSVMVWQNAATEKPQIPSGFNLEIITNYLKDFSSTLSFEDEDGDEIINSGTQKPVVKGRNMYQSLKLQMAEFGSNSRNELVFRAICHASLKRKEIRYPRVVISPEGDILEASCVCPANADSRCCHVATLLYLVEDLTFQNIPKLPQPSTSVPQYWGRGKKRDNDPKPAHCK